MLSAHGFTTNAGPRGSELSVGSPLIREHLIQEGFAWAASSYRCNGYVPGIGLQDTMALTDLFTKFNAGKAPQRVYLTGGSMGGHVTLLGMHEFPTSFAGGLAMCPSGPELFDYISRPSVQRRSHHRCAIPINRRPLRTPRRRWRTFGRHRPS
jgi:pimeloyl-ACP methyl ester carboxylesterase